MNSFKSFYDLLFANKSKAKEKNLKRIKESRTEIKNKKRKGNVVDANGMFKF
jgi:hypothetical protein